MTVLTDVPLLSLSLSWVTWRRAEGDRVESGPRNLPCQSSSMTIPLRRPTRLPSTSARNAPPPWQVCKREPTLTAYFSSDEKGRARTDANTVSGGSASVSPSVEDYSAQANQIAYETFSLVPEMTAAASVASGEQPYGPAFVVTAVFGANAATTPLISKATMQSAVCDCSGTIPRQDPCSRNPDCTLSRCTPDFMRVRFRLTEQLDPFKPRVAGRRDRARSLAHRRRGR